MFGLKNTAKSEKTESSEKLPSINEKQKVLHDYDNFKVRFTVQEKIKCLEEILGKLKKILYVYEKSIESGSQYNYKIYCGGILLYVSSSNSIFDGELVNLIVNLNSIISNDFDKSQIKRLVFESKNEIESLLKNYKQENEQNANL